MKFAISSLITTGLLLALAAPAAAHGPYVVVKDDGTLNGKVSSPDDALAAITSAMTKQGAALPEILSVWTAFDMDKNSIETLFDPAGNDVKGIGLENDYGGDGTITSAWPPVRAMLLHNNVLKLPARATAQNTPPDNFGDYIFLLELSHVWGPAVRIPVPDGGTSLPTELCGFDFHWSFWDDAGGSPAGGNRWKDNGDGTFTTEEQSPTDITYSMLDLYLMGFADPSEVPPFGVLENAVVPAGTIDPLSHSAVSGATFPWFSPQALTVTATRRTITIDDIIATNGPRVPAHKDSPQSFKLGIVLVVPADATDDQIATAEAAMDPVAVRLAPAFNRATRGRGTLEVTTLATTDGNDAGAGDDDDGGTTTTPKASPTASSSSGCTTTPASPLEGFGAIGVALGAAIALRAVRRKR